MEKETLFRHVCGGDPAAAQFLIDMVEVLHLWDDLIDMDKPLSQEGINQAFRKALIDIPRNPFYQRNFDVLNPVLMSAINNWHVANILEAGDIEDDLRIAFISRSSYIDLITQVAYIVGGDEWVKRIGPDIRRFTHREGWMKYQENLQAERAARSERSKGD